jgi:hypothetical protein
VARVNKAKSCLNSQISAIGPVTKTALSANRPICSC